MSDREIVFSVVLLVVAYYYFILRGKRQNSVTRGLHGRASTGRSGTVAGGASKAPTIHHNSNRFTNAQQGGGKGFSAALVANVGDLNPNPGAGNVGTLTKSARRNGTQSSGTTGLVGSFVSNAWPTRRVTSTGSQIIGRGITQVPSYAAVPLTPTGPGGGGSLVH